MKKIAKLLLAVIILFVNSCQKDSIYIEDINNTKTTNQQNKGFNNSGYNELIILYPDGTTDIEKQQKRIEYGVENYKQCKCADENLELWVFSSGNSGNINIEEKKETAKVDEEIESVGLNNTISIQQDQFISASQTGILDTAITKIVQSNTGITVAVLDTGVDYNYNGFTSPFLYNSGPDACDDNNYKEKFGWNFVENNNNPFDNYPGKHGTIVTNIITSNLKNNNIQHQILPVKIANANGNIKYFDALCGFKYAIKKENVKIVNMSFGWYSENFELLQEFIQEVENTILVVCSAGNQYLNNDIIPHYPSSYESENILAMAGLEETASIGFINSNPNLAYFSNYGNNSVDLAAASENIPFAYNNQIFYVNGTSFSTAYGSFFSALNYQNGMTAPALKNQVIMNSVFSQNLQDIKYSKHILNN
ncbi:S8 family serine peptidase [Olleya sp. R77988]|uniref:S8 family serine peptidase n=1 Tax=Olleya sp. R77988 TaxID=3093875 RepID=UPI0037CC8DEB